MDDARMRDLRGGLDRPTKKTDDLLLEGAQVKADPLRGWTFA